MRSLVRAVVVVPGRLLLRLVVGEWWRFTFVRNSLLLCVSGVSVDVLCSGSCVFADAVGVLSWRCKWRSEGAKAL